MKRSGVDTRVCRGGPADDGCAPDRDPESDVEQHPDDRYRQAPLGELPAPAEDAVPGPRGRLLRERVGEQAGALGVGQLVPVAPVAVREAKCERVLPQ